MSAAFGGSRRLAAALLLPVLCAGVAAADSGGTLVDVSSRLLLPAGGGTVAAGFSISGTGPLTVLARASGPSLGSFGVAGTAAHPVIELHGPGGTLLASNAGWDQTADGGLAVSQAGAAVGAFALLPSSGAQADSALVASLQPGPYSVVVADANGTGGVGLIEVYAVGTSGSRLINLSVRGFAGAGASVLSAGFVIRGANRYVLTRGIGPGLAPFGVSDAIGHPAVTLLTQSGTELATNSNWTNWSNDVDFLDNAVGAFALDPGIPDAAAVICLAPGSYTAQVSDLQGQTGESLIEIYEAPNGMTFPNRQDPAGIDLSRQHLNMMWSAGLDSSTGPVPLTAPPMALSDIGSLSALGNMVGGHVTPIDHIYYGPADLTKPPDTYAVRAVADGTVVQVELRPADVNQPPGYRVALRLSSTFFVYYDLIDSLDPVLQAALPGGVLGNGGAATLALPVSSGQIIGRIGARTLDFSVVNTQAPLNGFVVPADYVAEPWKIFTADPFNSFSEPLRTQLLAHEVRVAAPRGGKIDYDFAGALIGTWFLQGTNGYGGITGSTGSTGGTGGTGGGAPYYSGHLSLAYLNSDPKWIVISMGNYNGGSAQQFGVAGNAPAPESITQADGVVAYELISVPNGPPPVTPVQPAVVMATALFQLLPGNQLKVQVFPGLTRAQVSEFTAGALIYQR